MLLAVAMETNANIALRVSDLLLEYFSMEQMGFDGERLNWGGVSSVGPLSSSSDGDAAEPFSGLRPIRGRLTGLSSAGAGFKTHL